MTEWCPLRVDFMTWVAFYDKIYSHPEKPPNDVIEDDESLDAWLRKKQFEHRQAEVKMKHQEPGS